MPTAIDMRDDEDEDELAVIGPGLSEALRSLQSGIELPSSPARPGESDELLAQVGAPPAAAAAPPPPSPSPALARIERRAEPPRALIGTERTAEPAERRAVEQAATDLQRDPVRTLEAASARPSQAAVSGTPPPSTGDVSPRARFAPQADGGGSPDGGMDPALREAIASNDRNRRQRAIAAALGLLLGKGHADPGVIARVQAGGPDRLAEYRAMQQQRAAQQRAQLEQEDRALQRSRLGQQDELARERVGLDRQRLGLEERRVSATEARDQQQAERQRLLDEAKLGDLESERTRQTEMRDPASEISRRAQDVAVALGTRFGVVGGEGQLTEEQVRAMPAEELRNDPHLRELFRLSGQQQLIDDRGQYTRYRRGGPVALTGGRGGGEAAQRQRETGIAALVANGHEPQAAADLWDSLGPRQRQQVLRDVATAGPARAARLNREEGRQEVLPGVFASVEISPTEGAAVRRAFGQLQPRYEALSAIDAMARRYGATAAINPQARADYESLLPTMLSMVAELQNTGVIQPSERPAIEAILPSPADLEQMTFGTLQRRVQNYQRQLEGRLRAQLVGFGVDDEGINEALGMLRGGGGGAGGGQSRRRRPNETSGGDSVRVRINGGQERALPRARLEELQRRAAERGDRVEVLE